MTPPIEKVAAALATHGTLTVRTELPEGLAVAPEAVARAKDFARAATSENTRKAYASDWRHFAAWCETHHAATLPAAPATVAFYLSELADVAKPSTVARRLAAISAAHKAAGMPSPRKDAGVQTILRGIRREKGTAQRQARPLLPSDLRRIIQGLPEGLQGARDRALLLLGFAGAFRRSELVGLDVADLAFGDDGLTVHLRRSKTDQEGQGRKVGIPYGGDRATCPVRAVKAWLALSGIASGPIFRGIDRHGRMSAERLTADGACHAIKRLAGRDFSGHSLRAGLATAAAKAGKSAMAIQKQTGHKSIAMVARYVRDASLFEGNAASGIGL